MTRARGFRVALLVVVWSVAGCGGAAPADSSATPRIDCTGLPAARCDEAVASVARSLPNEHPSRIEVRCISDPCTAASGAMDTTVTLADGRQLHANPLTWSDPSATGGGLVPPAPGDPSLPVQPTCQGIPLTNCRQVAGGSFQSGHGAIVSILVRCTKNPCTAASGEGDTLVTYADGTQSTSGWGYANSGG
jgi:hypothetical protein